MTMERDAWDMMYEQNAHEDFWHVRSTIKNSGFVQSDFSMMDVDSCLYNHSQKILQVSSLKRSYTYVVTQ